jgi:hypothetical protein
MRARGVLIGLALGFALSMSPVPLSAWGLDVHRAITRRAIGGLPEPLRTFLGIQQAFIAEHSVDPDLWRVVGLSGALGLEDSNHYFHVDEVTRLMALRSLPHDRAEFVARVGNDQAERMGRLPWRVAEIYAKLVAGFRGVGLGMSPWAADNARYLSAVLAHYVQDATVPFHAVENYDGQLSEQHGVHSRFETALVLRHERRLRLTPVTITPIDDPFRFVVATLEHSAAVAPVVLEADRRAKHGRSDYDDGYFDAFFDQARPVLEARLSAAADAVASVVVAAWREAGQPALTSDRPR